MTEKRIYLKEWRRFRKLTQDQVVGRLEFMDDPLIPKTGASLSRLENGRQPYSQRVLEALAEVYQCEPADLIGKDPSKEGDVVDLMRRLSSTHKRQAIAIIEALDRAEGTNG